MRRNILKFSSLLLLIVLLVFALHLAVLYALGLPLLNDRLLACYSVNFLLAIIIYIVMLVLRHKYLNQLGFIFLFGSLLKFVVFFIVFYPFFKADGVISKTEFAAFFIPYAVSLIIEIFSLSKWLNKQGENP